MRGMEEKKMRFMLLSLRSVIRLYAKHLTSDKDTVQQQNRLIKARIVNTRAMTA